MFKGLLALTLLSVLILGTSDASAQSGKSFRLVSKVSGKCASLKAPDQGDGGGLAMQDCQNFPDFFVTATSNFSAAIQFQLNSKRFVCVFATENPVIEPGGALAKVMTRNCVGPTGVGIQGSLWNIRGASADGFQQIEKLKGPDPSGFCMRENTQTSEVQLDVCSGAPEQSWKLQPISIP